MKVKGFLKDVGGASRVTKARLAAFENASPMPVTTDPLATSPARGIPASWTSS